ncbi:hypothetical protein [Sciscionella sediminilitoris]|nr:hypothetical protein [Sciscionella sp. SE31]
MTGVAPVALPHESPDVNAQLGDTNYRRLWEVVTRYRPRPSHTV